MSRLQIVRALHGGGFAQIDNAVFRPGGRLSAQAVGLLGYLLTHSDGWDVSVAQLAREFANSTHAIEKALRELVDAGHLRRERTNTRNGFIHHWYVHEAPIGRMPIDGLTRDGLTIDGQSADIKNTNPKNTNPKNTNPKNTNPKNCLTTTSRGRDLPQRDVDAISEYADGYVVDPEKLRDLLAAKGVARPASWLAALEVRGELEGFLRGEGLEEAPIPVIVRHLDAGRSAG